MTAEEVLAVVLEAGGEIIPDVTEPRVRVPPKLRGLVLAHREALRDLIRAQAHQSQKPTSGAAVDRLLGMPLEQFALEGQPLEIKVPWWGETLFFAPDLRHAEALYRGGIARERVWTAHELRTLLGAGTVAPEGLQVVMAVRRDFEGEVVAARPRLLLPTAEGLR